MNLLQKYIESLPIDVAMSFGVNGHVKLNHIDIEDRLTRKGDISPKNFFMEFIKYDSDGEATQREEFSFFKLNAERMEFVEMNFNDQFNKLFHLCEVVYEYDADKLDEKMDAANDDLFDEVDGLLVMADELFSLNSPTKGVKGGKKKKKPSLKELKPKVENLNNMLNLFFFNILKDKVESKDVPEMKLLSTVDKKGYKQLPDEADFVCLMSEELLLHEKYLDRKTKAETPEVPDEVGDSIDDELTDDVVDSIGDIDTVGSLDDLGDLEDLETLDTID